MKKMKMKMRMRTKRRLTKKQTAKKKAKQKSHRLLSKMMFKKRVVKQMRTRTKLGSLPMSNLLMTKKRKTMLMILTSMKRLRLQS